MCNIRRGNTVIGRIEVNNLLQTLLLRRDRHLSFGSSRISECNVDDYQEYYIHILMMCVELPENYVQMIKFLI
jgi:hypothetical protein